MRILLCSVAAVALSGCSWMGMGQSHKGHSMHSSGQYQYQSNTGQCCFGDKKLSRWNVEGGLGTDFIVGGDAITGSDTHAGFVGPATVINDVSMDTAYENGFRAELGTSYAFTPNRKLTGQITYAKAEGEDIAFGSQDGIELRGQMSDYEAWGLEAGLRQYARPVRVPLLTSVRPYVEGKIGAAYVDSIALENIREVTPTVAATPTSLAMYESGWVPTGAGLVGIETPLFNRMTIGVETGIRYNGKPNSDVSSFGAPGDFNARYAGMNNGGDRFSVPLTIRGRYRF